MCWSRLHLKNTTDYFSSRFICDLDLDSSPLPCAVCISRMAEMSYGEGSGLDVIHVGDLLDYLGKFSSMLGYLEQL